jgi:hypothetical protein
MLDDPVLSRMVGDDDQRSAGRQAISQRGKRALESGKLVVHRDTKRLKQTGEFPRTAPGSEGARIAPTRSPLVSNGLLPRRRTISCERRALRGSSPVLEDLVMASSAVQ